MADQQGGWVGRETAGPEQDREQERRMSREEWIAYHVSRAPAITEEQWRDTLVILEGSRRRRGGFAPRNRRPPAKD